MGAPWLLVKAFLRQATYKADLTDETDIAVVRRKLLLVQQGHYDTATGSDGLVQISSTIGSTAFAFAVPGRLDRAQILEVSETALELIEGLTTIAQIRASLTRVKSRQTDFSRTIVT